MVGVITRPDAPTGRGRKLTPSPVKATALELGLPVIDLKPRSPEFMEALNNLHADIAAVIAYGNILPKNVLDAVPMAGTTCISPTCRSGVAPLPPSVRFGQRPDHRADVFKVGEGLDDGPIVASLTIELTGRETSGELLDRLAEEGAPMYVDALAAVGEGTATFTAQPAEGLEYAHKITVEDARISWTDEAEAIDRQVRACTPHPGAWTELFAEGPIADNDEPAAKPLTLHILAAQPADQSNPNTPAELQPGELKVGKKNVWLVPAARRWNSPKSRRRARRPCAPPTGPEARASPPPPACDNKQYRSRPEAQQKARHLREEDTGAFSAMQSAIS